MTHAATETRDVIFDVRSITLRFGGVVSLNDVTLQMLRGEILAVIGPNGAGKTSLFNCITGFYKPQRGEVIFDGSPTLALKPHLVTARGIARTFQNLRLFAEMSVLENVMAGMHCRTSAGALGAVLRTGRQQREETEIRAVALECLELVGIAEEKDRLATTLAYGHQRRVEIARALATRPQLLLLDEPAAGLNSGEKVELIGLIRRIRNERGTSVLLIEHDTGLVMQVSERIHVLDHGVMIAEGTAKEIQSDPKVIEAYLGQDTDELTL